MRGSYGVQAAAAGALAFALHPVQVESVGWASGTKDVLCGLFAIAALWAYVAAVRASDPGLRNTSDAGLGKRGRRRLLYLLATSLFLLAMLSKPTAIVVPLMAGVVDRLLLGRPWRTVLRWLWPWAVLMVPCALWTRAAQPAPWASPVPVWTRPLVATDAVAFYVGKVAWPLHLGVDYGRRPTAVYGSGGAVVDVGGAGGGGGVAGVAAVAGGDGGGGAVRVAAGAGVGAGAVRLSVLLDGGGPLPVFADGRVAVGVAGVANARPFGTAAKRSLVGAVLVALAVRTVVQTFVWQDTATLFRHGLAVNPQSFVSCDMLGYAASDDARRIRGDRHGVPPTDPRYAEWRDHLERSLVWYRRSLDRFPGYVPSLINIAVNTGQLGRHDEQRAALRQVVALQPTLPTAMRAEPVELVGRLLAADDPAAAAGYLDAQLRVHPGDVGLLMMRAQIGSARP